MDRTTPYVSQTIPLKNRTDHQATKRFGIPVEGIQHHPWEGTRAAYKVWGQCLSGVPPSQVNSTTAMLAAARSSTPKPVVPPDMMTRPLGAIPANVPQGNQLRGSSKLLCLLSKEGCSLCPASCPRRLIDCSSAPLGKMPMIGLARLALTRLIDSGELRSMQLELVRRCHRRRHRRSTRQNR